MNGFKKITASNYSTLKAVKVFFINYRREINYKNKTTHTNQEHT